MVAVKVKLNAEPSQIVVGDRGTHRSVGNRSFKVYSENERGKASSGCDSVDANTNNTRGTLMRSRLKSAPDKGGGIQINAKGKLKILEKSYVLHGTSVKADSARRALVDLSNVQRRQSKNEVHDPLKSLKGKSERSASLQRVPICSGTRSVIASSRKPPLGQVKNSDQGVGVFHASKQVVVIKDLNVSPNDQRTKGQVGESVETGSRMTERKPPLPTRKSLPVLKEVNQLDRSDVKGLENAETSEKSKGKYGFPVKTKVGRKVVSQVSNARSHLWRNRVSDGIINMASRDQNVDAYAISRNIKPIVKGTLTDSNAWRGSKVTGTTSLNISKSVAAVALKNKSEATTSSFSKKTSSVDSHKPTQGELHSDCNNSSRNTTGIIASNKSERRRSYTSLLMARSKLLEQHGEVKNQEQLPSIDDKCNQLEVAEYIDDLYQYYWVTEAQYPSLADYMRIQTEIIPQIRGILINWLIEVHFKFDLMQETLYLTVSLLDQYLSLVTIKKNEMQLVGLTALLLASKYEDFWHPRIKELISISADSYTSDQMLGMEKLILRKLKFRLNVPTPYVFMLRFLKAAQSDMKLEHLAFYLIELCLVQYEALKFKPSMLCASAIYLARCTLQMNPTWTPLLGKHARYDESQIRGCAEMILRFQKAAKTTQLNVTYEKFLKPDHSCVAAIRPLDQLPS